jgi:GRAS domain family protein
VSDLRSLFAEAAVAAEADDREALTAVLKRARAVSPGDPLLRDYYLAGFAARLDGAKQGNLYLRAEKVPQIDLFGVLRRHLPVLRAARLANDNLLPVLRGHGSATVLALGIGPGHQECDLVARAPRLRSLTVIGVDVAGGSLTAARTALRTAGYQAGTTVEFHAVESAAEDLDESAWDLVRQAPRPLVVTASFALHYMRDTDGLDARAVLFRRLRDLEPAAVALCESDSDHHHVPLRARFANSWHHYGTLFAAIDSTSATRSEKAAMKQFFGREIQNVIGACDEDRVERHEPVHAWADRLVDQGFRLLRPHPPEPEAREGFTAVARPAHIELAYRDTPLAAVLLAEPR